MNFVSKAILSVLTVCLVSFTNPLEAKTNMTQFDHSTGSYLTIDGANIYYEEIGDANKPAVLLLHGGMQDMEEMNPIATYLAPNYRVIGIDSRGHGKSTLGNQPLTYERIELDVEAVLKHLDIHSPIIIGFSDGGTVGYRMAISKTVKVEKLIAIGADWSISDVTSSEPMFKKINPASAKDIFADSYQIYKKLNPEPQFETFTQAVLTMWRDKTSAGHPDMAVKEIECPVLLIRGDNDPLTSLESISELRNLLAKASFLNVAFATHEVYKEQALICQEAIRQFLTKE